MWHQQKTVYLIISHKGHPTGCFISKHDWKSFTKDIRKYSPLRSEGPNELQIGWKWQLYPFRWRYVARFDRILDCLCTIWSNQRIQILLLDIHKPWSQLPRTWRTLQIRCFQSSEHQPLGWKVTLATSSLRQMSLVMFMELLMSCFLDLIHISGDFIRITVLYVEHQIPWQYIGMPVPAKKVGKYLSTRSTTLYDFHEFWIRLNLDHISNK